VVLLELVCYDRCRNRAREDSGWGILAKLLNGLENYQVVLIPLATKKEIGCSAKGCVEILQVASPDDTYTEIALEKPDGKSIEREYTCPQGHTTKVYWYYRTEFIGLH